MVVVVAVVAAAFAAMIVVLDRLFYPSSVYRLPKGSELLRVATNSNY